MQQEQTIERLENERAELMVTIQKGEGADTAIQQLQQDNVCILFLSFFSRTYFLFVTDSLTTRSRCCQGSSYFC